MRRYPPHHLSPARANHPAGQDPEARLSRPRSPQQRSDQARKPVNSEQENCSLCGRRDFQLFAVLIPLGVSVTARMNPQSALNLHAPQHHFHGHIGKRLACPAKTKSPVLSFSSWRRIATARADKGTRCSRPAFIRSAGTVQIFLSRSISGHRIPRQLTSDSRQNPSAANWICFHQKLISADNCVGLEQGDKMTPPAKFAAVTAGPQALEAAHSPQAETDDSSSRSRRWISRIA
jgi:hypothetical protein